MTHTGEKEIHAGFWRGNLKDRDRLEDLHVYSRMLLKCILNFESPRNIIYMDLMCKDIRCG